MIALVKAVLALGAAVYAGVALSLLLLQGRLVYRPYKTLEATPADVGLAYEDLRLASGDETIHAWFVPASSVHESKDVRATVLFCHGNGGNISHRLETLAILHGLGLNTLIFDYQGYGESSGSPGEGKTYQDATACWNWLVGQLGEKPERIVVMGRSLGGAVAAWVAEEFSPAGLVLESTFTSVPDMGAGMYPWLPVRLLSRIAYDTRSRLARIDCPVLVAHSPEDDMVPYSFGRELLAAAGPGAGFLELQGDHNTGYLLTGEAYAQGLDRFFANIFSNPSIRLEPLSGGNL